MQCCEEHLDLIEPPSPSSPTVPGEPDVFSAGHAAAGDTRDAANQRLADLVRLEEHAAFHLAGAAHAADVSKSHRVDGARSVAAWLAKRLSVARADAHRAVRRGRTLAAHPLLERAWRDHDITGAHVDRFARLIDDNPDVADLLRRDEQLLVDSAGGLTPEEFRQLCDRWRDLADPDAAYARWRRRHERRHLSTSHDLEGNLVFNGRLDGADGEVFFQAIAKRENELFLADWAAAKADLGRTPTVGELHRTSAQRRIDSLADLVRRGSGVTGEADPESVPEVAIDYVVDDETMQEGLDRIFGTGPSTGDPCDRGNGRGADTSAAFDPRRCCQTLDGLPVPPEVVIRDAFRARIRRVVFSGSSVIIDAGRSRRLFDGPQRDLVRLRDRRCRHPFCTTPHWRCEIDHVVPAADGGATDLANAALLCPTHHDDKSAGRVEVRAGPNGRLVWFRPDGRLLGVS